MNSEPASHDAAFFVERKPWQRTPIKLRPMPVISDLVTETLPILLSSESPLAAAASEGFAQRLEEALQPWTVAAFLEQTPAWQKLACLDLAMLAQAHYHTDLPLPDAFWTFFRAICREHQRLPILLYEDCVLVNPLDQDPRLFRAAPEAASERDFLRIHVSIEARFGEVIAALSEVLSTGSKGSEAISRQLALISSARQQLTTIATFFATMYRLPREDFALFRHFYSSPPGTSYFGPSGRFSARYYTIRVQVEGRSIERVLPGFFDELLSLHDYFPCDDREVLRCWLPPGVVGSKPDGPSPCFRSLADLPRHPALDKEIGLLRDTLDGINGKHFGLVHKYVVREERNSHA